MSMTDISSHSLTKDMLLPKYRTCIGCLSYYGGSFNSISFNGCTLSSGGCGDRLQLFFDSKPSPETLLRLKNKGFAWSRDNLAWEIQWSEIALYDAKKILGYC